MNLCERINCILEIVTPTSVNVQLSITQESANAVAELDDVDVIHQVIRIADAIYPQDVTAAEVEHRVAANAVGKHVDHLLGGQAAAPQVVVQLQDVLIVDKVDDPVCIVVFRKHERVRIVHGIPVYGHTSLTLHTGNICARDGQSKETCLSTIELSGMC